MKLQYLALIGVWLLTPGETVSAAEYHYDAGMTVVSVSPQQQDGPRSRTDFRLMGAARLQTGESATFGAVTCNGHVIKSSSGQTQEDASDCIWTGIGGDRIFWRYEADPVNSGPGFQRARLKAVSGTGKWRGVSGVIVTDVMVKPEFPNSPVNFIVGKGTLTTEGKP
jgi:hypothetical protein